MPDAEQNARAYRAQKERRRARRKELPDRLVGIEEILAYTGLSRDFFRKLRQAGAFPQGRELVPGRPMWRWSEVEAWVESRPVC